MSDTLSSIPYGQLMHDAVCGVIRTVLTNVAEHGLPGDHYFYITFETTHEGAELSAWLRERYPAEMMIVIQNWYEDLDVSEDRFAVTLNFGDTPERLVVPFEAILTFVDPSVEFGWRFERSEEEEEDEQVAESKPAAEDESSDQAKDRSEDHPEQSESGESAHNGSSASGDAEVVSLDTFRRNH